VVDDEGTQLDMDTPADLDRLRAFAENLTESVCPVCLRRVTAWRVPDGDDVYLAKSCPEHGDFRTIIWRGAPRFGAWGGVKRAEHRQQTCCVVMEVTERCNLSCPYCFASAGGAHRNPSIQEIEQRCRKLLDCGGPVNLQLSGGEPTVRDDIPEIVSMALSLGFPFVQLNTNGLRLATDSGYASALKRAGLGCAFLQFDGVTEDVHRRIRGHALLDVKLAAIHNCRAAELGVVLVPTLVPGVNTAQIGEIIRFAIAQMPAVRAVHFQPVSYFGRFPHPPADADRITIPEVLREIERQTDGQLKAAHFRPPKAESAWCSFQGKFVVRDGVISPSAVQPQGCCGAAPLVQLGANPAQRARQSVARQWAFPQPPGVAPMDSLDEFLARDRDTISISGMAFQDAWNLDLDRLRDCFLHAASDGGKLVPLCAYNLTAADGRGLYRVGGSDA
jgi:7,8-dihydro-6-hydroxymethylpterin dimethyltransferase